MPRKNEGNEMRFTSPLNSSTLIPIGFFAATGGGLLLGPVRTDDAPDPIQLSGLS
jgi:hypothetical protein